MKEFLNQVSQNVDHFIFKHLDEISQKAFFVYDLFQHKIIYLSPGFKKIWESSNENLISDPKSVLNSIHPDDKERLQSKYLELVQKASDLGTEFRIISESGTVKWICLEGYSVKDENGGFRWITGFADDISKRKEYENYLVTINEKKNSTLAIVAHDLATPIVMIQTITNLMEKEFQLENSEPFTNYISLIRQVCMNSMNLIHDILNEEHLQSETTVVSKSRLEVIIKISNIFDTYNMAGKNLVRKLTLTPLNEKIYANLDEIKFMQVMNNLISNALKFTRDNGSISVDVKEKEKSIVITVTDDGIGIPDKMKPYIFDRFSKARRPGLNGEKSVGLGMSIIKTLVELHRGKIWFESQENVGTSFFVELPKE